MFLLDTNVVSELRKGGGANPRVRRWAGLIAPIELYLSVISVLELEIGILRVERRDPPQGANLRSGLEERGLTAFDVELSRLILPWRDAAPASTSPTRTLTATPSLQPQPLSTE